MKDPVVALISQVVAELLWGSLWRNRLSAVAAAVVGLILSGLAVVVEIGNKVPGHAKVVNKVKRVWRLVHNHHLDLERIAARLIEVLTSGHRNVVLAIDWTDIGRWKVLKAAIVRGDRAIPVYWMVVSERKVRLAEVELRLCETLVLRLVPMYKRLFIIADRGFDSSDTLRFLKERRIKFLIRFSRGRCLRLKGQNFILVENMPLLLGQTVDYRWAEYTKNSKLPLRIVRIWKQGQDEEWNLATNLGRDFSAERIAKLYARRFTIEELFRDYKGGVWGLGVTTFKSEEALSNFLIILAVAYIVTMAVGLHAREHGLEAEFRSTEGLSLFLLGKRLLNADKPELLPRFFDLHFNRLPVDFEEIWTIPWRSESAREGRPYDQRGQKSPAKISGECLRLFLLLRKLTQTQVATVIGIRQNTVSMVCRNRIPMPAAWLPRLTTHYGVTADEFLSLVQEVESIEATAAARRKARQLAKAGLRPPQLPQEYLDRVQEAFVVLVRERGIKQTPLSKILNVSQSRVSRAISGKSPCPPHWIPLLCAAFELTEEDLLAAHSLKPEPALVSNNPAPSNVRPDQSRSVKTPARPHRYAVQDVARIQRAFVAFARERSLTQTQLAKDLRVSQSRVSRALSGQNPCQPHWIALLCEAYPMTEPEFLARSTDQRHLPLGTGSTVSKA